MLESILIEMKKYPTIMDINDEILFIKKLQAVSTNEIVNNEIVFFDILSLLGSSHEQTIFQVDGKNIKIFESFSNWLLKLKCLFPDRNLYLKNLAEDMSATFG